MQVGLTFKLPPVIEAFKIIHGCNGISKRPTGSKNFLQYKLFRNKQPFCYKHWKQETVRTKEHRRDTSQQMGYYPAHRRATSFEAQNWQFFWDPKSVLSLDSLKFVHPLMDRGPRFWKIVNFTTLMTPFIKGFPGFYEVARLWASSPSVGYLLWSLQCKVIQWCHALTDNFIVLYELWN